MAVDGYVKELEVRSGNETVLTFFTRLSSACIEVEPMYIYTATMLHKLISKVDSQLPPYNTWDEATKSAKAEVSTGLELKYKLLRGESLRKRVENARQHVGWIAKDIFDKELPIFSAVSILKDGANVGDYLVRGKFLCIEKNVRILYALLSALGDTGLPKVLDGHYRGTIGQGATYEMVREVVLPYKAFKFLLDSNFALLFDFSSVLDYDYAACGEQDYALSGEMLNSFILKTKNLNSATLSTLQLPSTT